MTDRLVIKQTGLNHKKIPGKFPRGFFYSRIRIIFLLTDKKIYWLLFLTGL